jgi:hypothetical protein
MGWLRQYREGRRLGRHGSAAASSAAPKQEQAALRLDCLLASRRVAALFAALTVGRSGAQMLSGKAIGRSRAVTQWPADGGKRWCCPPKIPIVDVFVTSARLLASCCTSSPDAPWASVSLPDGQYRQRTGVACLCLYSSLRSGINHAKEVAKNNHPVLLSAISSQAIFV